MSNSLAIASVTATLRRLLEKGGIEHVTVRPLDKAPDGINADKQRINLFLYQALPDAAFRNMDMPGRVKSGETGHPPLPLTLYYLLTAYGGNEEDQTKSHALLGEAMRVFHDHPLFGAEEIRDAVKANQDLAGSDLADQVERIRITLQPLLFEEMSKLWTTFQIHYRLSAAYQVSVVLIESTRPARTPLPVLIRQIAVYPSVLPPFPTLTGIAVPKREPIETLKTDIGLRRQQPSALLGDQLLINGHHLAGESVVVQLMNQQLKDPIGLQVQGSTTNELKVIVPEDLPGLLAGLYTLSAIVSSTGQTGQKKCVSNALSLSIAPKIELIPRPVRRDEPFTIRRGELLTIQCLPKVGDSQRVVLLIGDQELVPEARPTQTDQLKFRLKNVVPGTYFVRLRVDGVDSLLIDWSKLDEEKVNSLLKKWHESNTPPQFYDEAMKVVVQ